METNVVFLKKFSYNCDFLNDSFLFGIMVKVLFLTILLTHFCPLAIALSITVTLGLRFWYCPVDGLQDVPHLSRAQITKRLCSAKILVILLFLNWIAHHWQLSSYPFPTTFVYIQSCSRIPFHVDLFFKLKYNQQTTLCKFEVYDVGLIH